MAERDEWPGAAAWVPERPSLSSLRARSQLCRGCDLFKDATQAVMGDGPTPASVLALGEQPGDREDQEGEPFVGPAGRILDEAFAEAGLDRDSVYRTNAVKHFRHEVRGKRRIHKGPAQWQVAKCEPWLLAELDLVQPQVVVLLGATAGKAVYGPGFKVTAARGNALSWPEESHASHRPGAVVATIHPSAVLRSRTRDEMFAGLVADLTRVAELVTSGVKPRDRERP